MVFHLLVNGLRIRCMAMSISLDGADIRAHKVFMNTATKNELNAITNLDIEAASELFQNEGWTEMHAELWASLEDGTEAGRGKLLRLIRHYRAQAA